MLFIDKNKNRFIHQTYYDRYYNIHNWYHNYHYNTFIYLDIITYVMIRTRIHRLGDSKAVLIPKTICDMLDLDVGTKLNMMIDNDKIILEKIMQWTRENHIE